MQSFGIAEREKSKKGNKFFLLSSCLVRWRIETRSEKKFSKFKSQTDYDCFSFTSSAAHSVQFGTVTFSWHCVTSCNDVAVSGHSYVTQFSQWQHRSFNSNKKISRLAQCTTIVFAVIVIIIPCAEYDKSKHFEHQQQAKEEEEDKVK